ncbi:MAG TPA: hypothetical protein VM686_28600, partial [Polyangiaceae bacterium]|nr:hypothetical protein [Polyangiaceae bacterium]
MSELTDDELSELLAGLRQPPPEGDFEARLHERLAGLAQKPRPIRRPLVAAALVTLAAAAGVLVWLGARSSQPAVTVGPERPAPSQSAPALPTAVPEEKPATEPETPPEERRSAPAPRLERLEPRALPPAPRAPERTPAEVSSPDTPRDAVPVERPRLERLDVSGDRLPRAAGSAPRTERAIDPRDSTRAGQERPLTEHGVERPPSQGQDAARERKAPAQTPTMQERGGERRRQG